MRLSLLALASLLWALLLPSLSLAQPLLQELPALERQVARTGYTGTALVHDAATDTWYTGDAELAQQRFIPASTFKIFSALVALETGVIAGVDSVMP